MNQLRLFNFFIFACHVTQSKKGPFNEPFFPELSVVYIQDGGTEWPNFVKMLCKRIAKIE